MLDETTVEVRSGNAAQLVRIYCDGTREHPHERAQFALFAHEEGAAWPDGHAHWEWVDGAGEWQNVAEGTELSTRDVAAIFRGHRAGDPYARLILWCEHCPRRVRRRRREIERRISLAIVELPAVAPNLWELPVAILN